jgi:hypothetical protein
MNAATLEAIADVSEAMIQRAIKGIGDSIAATNGYLDNDYRIKVEILEPCLADLAALNSARDAILKGARP